MTDRTLAHQRASATVVARAAGDVLSAKDYCALLIHLDINHAEAARRMGVSRRTSWHWASKGAPKDMAAKLMPK